MQVILIHHKFWTSSTLLSGALHLLCKFSLPETSVKNKRMDRNFLWEQILNRRETSPFFSPLFSFSREKESPVSFLHPVLKSNLSNSARIWLDFSHPWQEELEQEQLQKWDFLALSAMRVGNEHKRENKPHICTSPEQLDVIQAVQNKDQGSGDLNQDAQSQAEEF